MLQVAKRELTLARSRPKRGKRARTVGRTASRSRPERPEGNTKPRDQRTAERQHRRESPSRAPIPPQAFCLSLLQSLRALHIPTVLFSLFRAFVTPFLHLLDRSHGSCRAAPLEPAFTGLDVKLGLPVPPYALFSTSIVHPGLTVEGCRWPGSSPTSAWAVEAPEWKAMPRPQPSTPCKVGQPFDASQHLPSVDCVSHAALYEC
jgi:hypothetical protein